MSTVPEQTSIPRYAPRTEPPERYCDLRLLAEYEKAKAENKQRPAVAATADVQEVDGTFRVVNTVITTATGAVITGKAAVPVESEYIPPFQSLHDFINDLS